MIEHMAEDELVGLIVALARVFINVWARSDG